MVALVEHKDLGFVLEAAKGGRVDHPVAIAPERAAGPARRLVEQPSAAAIGIAGIDRASSSHSDRHGVLILIQLIPQACVLNYARRGIPNELGMTPIGDQS